MLKTTTTTMIVLAVVITAASVTGCSSRKQTAATPMQAETAVARPSQNPQVAPSARPVQEAPSQPTSRDFRTVYFDYDNSNIRADQMSIMNRNAELASSGTVQIRIEGHCDERGSDEYNMALGQRRADAAKNFLINYGVKNANITTVSYGEMRPAIQGHDESAWSMNRRDEFVVVSE